MLLCTAKGANKLWPDRLSSSTVNALPLLLEELDELLEELDELLELEELLLEEELELLLEEELVLLQAGVLMDETFE